MIRNSVTLYEGDALDVVGLLEDLLEYVDNDPTEFVRKDCYIERIKELKDKIEKAVC